MLFRSLYEAALAAQDFAVPQSIELNPPLWELGHIGWFQTHWIGRNPDRLRGASADPLAQRLPAARRNADALYDSSRVAQNTRWNLPLPGAQATRADLAEGLAQSLHLLACNAEDDRSLYFHRLCLFHEDMHHEAALYTAQALGLAVTDPRWQPQPVAAAVPLTMSVSNWTLGAPDAMAGFAFDNELGAHAVPLAPCQIDSQVLRWADYLPFIEAGAGPAAPRYLRQRGGVWQQQRWGLWQALDLNLPACHLSAFEAQAFCTWAGRRLPTEAEWECAAMTLGGAFEWGSVWEWTASPFAPYPGFVAHPYRDYSVPWFDGRPVLRGGSFGTQPRMKNPRYRNYFEPARNDIFAGFRTCAL